VTVRCPACSAAPLARVLDLGRQPAHCSVLWPDEEAALRAPQAEIELSGCPRCGHVYNTAFVPGELEYEIGYDNSLHWSATFRRYAQELADRLVSDFDLHGVDVAEVGCGHAEFLGMLAAAGNRGIGYDPTFRGDAPAGVTVVRDYFRRGTQLGEARLLCARHVLEHVPDPVDFLTSLREAAPEDCAFYLEVPNGGWNFAAPGPWDFIYAHVSYFTEASLTACAQNAGLTVTASGTGFGGQFLWVEAAAQQPGDAPAAAVPPAFETLAEAAARQAEYVRTLDDELGRRARAGGVALWGAGAKGVTLLNTIDRSRRVGLVVDQNPSKWGRHVPGTGHRVDSPAAFEGGVTGTVLCTNPAYVREIEDELRQLGLDATILQA